MSTDVIVRRDRVYAVLPIIQPVSLDSLAYRYADRFNDSGCDCDELAAQVKAGVARACRKLRSEGRAEGPPWKRV